MSLGLVALCAKRFLVLPSALTIYGCFLLFWLLTSRVQDNFTGAWFELYGSKYVFCILVSSYTLPYPPPVDYGWVLFVFVHSML